MYTITSRVGASQTGPDGRMKLVSAIDVIQDCSLFWMESEPSFSHYLSEHRLGMFLLFRQADILRLPQFGEPIAAATCIYDCKGFYGYRNTVLYGGDGAPCVKTWGLGAFVSLESGRMVRLPKEEMERVTLDPKLEMDYQSKRILLPDTPGHSLPPIPVRRNDIDFNGHMNNARYLEAALELLPSARPVGRLRVEYRSAARPGALLHPRLVEEPDRAFLTLSDAQAHPYAVVELVFS